MPLRPNDPSRRAFPRALFSLAFAISLLATLFSGWQLWRQHEHSEEMARKHVAITQAVGRIMLVDEILSMSARMASATGNFSYEKRYDEYDPLLTKAIEALRALLPQADMEQFAQETDEANLALVKMERQAFALAHQGRGQEATALLASDEYSRLKNIYAGGMRKTVEAADALIESDSRKSYILSLKVVAASALSVLVLLLAWLLAVRSAQLFLEERKRAEEALARESYRNQVFLRNASDGVHILDADGNVLEVSDSFCEMLGYSRGELMGANVSLWDTQWSLQELKQVIAKQIAKGGRSIFETHHRRRDGSVLDVEITGQGLELDGKPVLFNSARDITERKLAEEQIRRYVEQLKTAFMSTVKVATIISEMRDPYTAGHERRVAEIAVAIGAELGFDARRQEGLRVAGHLHDVGKITIPAEILSKPGKLSAIEFQLIQGHAQASYAVLKGVEWPWPVAEVALQHHERMDGSGYPQGLKGDAILLEARIMAVADVVEAMSSHRPYRPALGIDKALAEVEHGRGTVYDADAVDACLGLFREKRYQLPA